MELKQETGARIDGALILLIVPYGIETVDACLARADVKHF